MDALSGVLKAVRLTGAVYVEAELRAGWSYLTPPPEIIGGLLMPEADHIAPYHLVTEGRCTAALPDGESVLLETGDLVLFPRGDRHVLASAHAEGATRQTVAVKAEDLRALLRRGEVLPLRHGSGGEVTRIACGYLACDRRLSQQVLGNLPRMLHVSMGGSEIAAWVRSSVRLSVAESSAPRAGGELMLAKLSELLFVEAIRQYVEALPEGQAGWLAGLRDRYVGRALALLHDRPAHPWTVDELGRSVGLSRSALAQRFNELVGQPPMQYLTQWRLGLAAQLLRASDRPVAQVADEVGYESEAAFNRAFKRELGVPPAAWRRGTLARESAVA